MIFVRILRLVCICVVLGALCVPGGLRLALAQPQFTTLRLSTVDNIPPYVFMKDGELTGISIDIIRELARRGGFQVEFHPCPWARVLLRLEQGVGDGAFSAYKNKEREVFCLYTGVIHYDELRVAVRADKRFEFTGLESLYGKVVGKGRGVFVSKAFDEAAAAGKFTLMQTDDMKMLNIKQLHEGRLDAVIGSPGAMEYYARELDYHDMVLLPQALREKIPAYLVLSKRSLLSGKKQWQRRITRILKQMRRDGTVQAINGRYGVSGF